MRAALAALFLLAASAAWAAALTVDFAGERYHLAYEDEARLPDGAPGDALAEFTLKGETVSDWTRLFGFYAYPQAGDDPVLAATTLGRIVKEKNKDANFQVVESPETGEAIIDFLTWEPGSAVMEFNVFKYARAGYGPGLVAMQYAQRLTAQDTSVEEMRALRARSVKAMAGTDIAQARNYFAAKAKARLGAAQAGPER